MMDQMGFKPRSPEFFVSVSPTDSSRTEGWVGQTESVGWGKGGLDPPFIVALKLPTYIHFSKNQQKEFMKILLNMKSTII